MVLKGLLRLEMSIILIPLRQAMQLREHKHEPFFTTPIPVVEILKNPDPHMLEFSFSGHPGALLNLPKIARSAGEHSLTTKNTHTPRKIKILR